MYKTNGCSVKMQSIGRHSIELVSVNWGVEPVRMGTMYAQLVRSPSHGEKGHARFAIVALEHFPMGGGGLAVLMTHHLARKIIIIRAQGEFDGALIALNDPVQHGDVLLFQCAFDELLLNEFVGPWIFGEDQNTRGRHI